ncbi:hypothetical protein [Pseudoalteromonas phenolica]|uniref:hypothetical protein n=1 Tax=Pseudoalteromonas phenolica TaxID=161398 RepID=UPI00110A3088|nr:hypothetical protein [Pseudoalteromonas phenolica]TMO55874.1 hypothetical protein CWC21_08040 [Pseudoalteromonas phenolica]
MTKLNKFASYATIGGFIIAVSSLVLATDAETGIINNNQNNHGSIINQPNSPITINNNYGAEPQESIDAVSTFNGAGAMLLKKPDMEASNSINSHPLHIGRLVNGTGLNIIGETKLKAHPQLDMDVTWFKVKIANGTYAGTIGWLPMYNVKYI